MKMKQASSFLVNIFCLACTFLACASGNHLKTSKSKLDRKDESVHRFRRDQYTNTYNKLPKNHQLLLDYGWSPRQLNSFSATSLLGMGSSQVSPTEFVYPASGAAVSSEDDNVVAAGHNHGWGWGHGHGKGCNSALGLLGILGLASYLQMNGFGLGGNNNNNNGGAPMPPPAGNLQPTNTNGMGMPTGSRYRRSVSDPFPYSQLYDSTSLIVPYLLNLNHIREGYWPVDCSLYTICMLSQTVSRGLKKSDREMVRKSLKTIAEEILVNPSVTSSKLEELELMKEIDWAAKVGMRSESCATYFKIC